MQPFLAALAALGVATYPFLEAKWYRLNRLNVSLGRPVPRTTVLHISDTHLIARDKKLIAFIRSLPGRIPVPDLIVATGDLIEDNSGIGPITTALNALPARHGRFYVLGSHDYYQSHFQSYLKYFTGRRHAIKATAADTKSLEERLRGAGWVAVTNRTEQIQTEVGTVRVSGVDDPYLRREETDHIERASDEVLAIGLAHAPDVVSQWMLQGFDLVFTGHTHAGQVRVPGFGAVVTNSSLPTELAGGLHRVGSGWLHVSPGLGTGRFAPIRFNCRPEATLLEITA
jgi:predicted MPP superfamily phosphohydrolase